MKIISTYKDYYDGVVNSVGIDNTIIYNRENKTINLNSRRYFKLFSSSHKSNNYFEFRILGVAGKLYPLVIVKDYAPSHNTYIYDTDEIRQFHSENFNAYWKRYTKIDDYFKQFDNDVELLNIFQTYKCKSFMISLGNNQSNLSNLQNINIELEPNLKNIQFQTIVDPFTLFNQMSQFISEQLNTEVTSSELTDIQKIETKGFDKKLSFRHRI